MSWRFGLVLVLWSITAIAGPRGRVIRVERTSGGRAVAPRFCVLHAEGGMCLGEQPAPGQTVRMLDEQHVVAEVQIVETTSSLAGCPNLWMVKTREVNSAPLDSDGLGVIDPNLDPNRAHALDKAHMPESPSGLSGDDVWQAIDSDGDGSADIVVTRYGCDSAGKPATRANTYCIDVWARIGSRMTRTTHFSQCSP